MNIKDFIRKWHIRIQNPGDEILLVSVLDSLYTQFTPEQVQEIVADFYDHADDLFNDMRDQERKIYDKLLKLFGIQTKVTEEEKIDPDKCDA